MKGLALRSDNPKLMPQHANRNKRVRIAQDKPDAPKQKSVHACFYSSVLSSSTCKQ
jgi:hypothetical protein